MPSAIACLGGGAFVCASFAPTCTLGPVFVRSLHDDFCERGDAQGVARKAIRFVHSSLTNRPVPPVFHGRTLVGPCKGVRTRQSLLQVVPGPDFAVEPIPRVEVEHVRLNVEAFPLPSPPKIAFAA